MKSMEMSDHGLEGTGSGCRRSMRDLEDVLFRAQTEHASMYSRTSSSMDGHQNCREMMNIVLLTLDEMKAVRCEPNASPVDVTRWEQISDYLDIH